MTFFFQVLYFQYKLNELIDGEGEAATPGVHGSTPQSSFGSRRII
jgi:hypothetical protein